MLQELRVTFAAFLLGVASLASRDRILCIVVMSSVWRSIKSIFHAYAVPASTSSEQVAQAEKFVQDGIAQNRIFFASKRSVGPIA